MSDRKRLWRRLLPNSGSPYNGQGLANNEIRLLTIQSISRASKSPEWWVSARAKTIEHGREIIRTSSDISIELQTQTHKLTEDLDYDAISYVWGAAPASVTIICNNTPLLITPTLHEMLQYLHQYQAKTAKRKVWIDAICINQTDKKEKSTQIPLMRDVYSQAATVTVWMGPSTTETDVFFAEFQDVRNRSRNWKALYDADRGYRNPVQEELPQNVYAFSEGLSQLLHNEWFRRLRTYQEIVLPPKATLLCGDSWVDFDDMLDFIMDGVFHSGYIRKMSSIGCDEGTSIVIIICVSIHFYRSSISQQGRTNVIDSKNVAIELHDLRRRHVREPVDRIWAIAGLLESDLRDSLTSEVDYSEQGRAQYWRTWTTFAKTLIKEPHGVELLNVPPTLEPRPSYLPSWCPNLSGRTACNMEIDGKWNNTMSTQKAAISWALGEENSQVKCAERIQAVNVYDKRSIGTRKHDNLLRVRGFALDTVEEVVEHEKFLDSAFHIHDPDSEEHMSLYDVVVEHHLKSLALACRAVKRKRGDITDIPDDFIMALFLDCRITEEARKVYRETLPQLSSWYFESWSHVTWEQVQCQHWLINMRGHTFFSTRGGRIGFAHPGCKPGDQVAAFYGGEPLYILRQLDAREHDIDSTGQASDHVQYMGAAFIPHLMEQHQRDAAHLEPDTMFMIH